MTQSSLRSASFPGTSWPPAMALEQTCKFLERYASLGSECQYEIDYVIIYSPPDD